MSSEVKDKDEFALEITKAKHQHWCGLEEILKHEFLRLVRIRDFLSLILMYPMIIPDQHLLKSWRDDAQLLTAKYFEDIDCVGIKVSGAYRWMHLLSEKPLKNMEVLIPNDILSKIEEGRRSIFNENTATLSGEAVASASTSKGREVLELDDVHNVTPEAILDLAADLAIDQLIRTLLTDNFHHVMFSTRNASEKIDVVRKIKAALNYKYNGTTISNEYSRVLWVDASKYSRNIEARVGEEIAQQLDLMTSEGDQTGKSHLVFLVDGNSKGKVDPWKVGFTNKKSAGVVVLLTIESSVQEHDGLLMAMDLEIRTEDHLMPWELFCRNVGRELVHSSSDIQRIAVEIVELCRGHLLAIVLVARSLKNIEDVELWKLAQKKLHYLNPLHASRIRGDMNRVMVNAFINIIWNNLNKTEKLCLKCSLFVLRLEENMADHVIMSSWIYNKLVYSREEAEHILRNFVHRCILLKLEQKYIRWPEEIYDVLRSLLMLYSLDTIKKGGLGLTEMHVTGEWLLARQIELMDNKFSELPLTMDCPKLTRLLLQGNTNLMEIPPLFFHHMPHLHVLDLSSTSIRSLPGSLFNLEDLEELYLKGCKRLMELPPEIGKLKKLEILDVDSTPITYIPEEIRELTKLKKLILSFSTCHDRKKSRPYPIPPGVISKLTRLLYLSIDVDPDNKHWDKSIVAILYDISELQNLITLNLYIPQVELLNYVPLCFDFRFVVGNWIQPRILSHVPHAVETKFKQNSCSLRIVNGVSFLNDIFEVIQRSEALFLERHRTIKNLSQIDMRSLAHLQSFIVGECSEMQTLIDGRCSIRPNLCWRFLCLFCMNNLRSICEVKACFYLLKIIELHNCPKLTSIFTLNFIDSLEGLEELIVEDCSTVSTLVSLESFESKEGIFLPRLRKVSLLYLPELVSISSGLCIGPCLERIGFYDCPKLQILSAKELLSQNLKVIKGEKEWWNALKWEEAEWGREGRPDYLHHKFSPINEELDIFEQLLEVEESSRSNKTEVENLDVEADVFSISNNEKDDDESSRSNNNETSEAQIVDLSVRDDVESSKSTGEVTLVENLHEEADIFPNFNNEKDDDESSRPDNMEISGMFHNILNNPNADSHRTSIKGMVVLMKKLVLDLNNLATSVVDRLHELVGNRVSLQLISSVNVDPGDGLRGRLGKPAYLEDWITTITPLTAEEVAFRVTFEWDEEIGTPGAFLIRNNHPSEFYLRTLTLENVPHHGIIHFVCNSWVYNADKYKRDRVFFANKTFLPSETPKALLKYREEELENLRGDGKGELKEWDRVYDYAYYNDLSNPDKPQLVRPILGGSSQYPYPRRGRTGRPSKKSDPNVETGLNLSLSFNIYVPRDERISHVKVADALGYALKFIVQVLKPDLEFLSDSTPNEFDSFQDVLKLYQGGIELPEGIFKDIRENIPAELIKEILQPYGEKFFKFPTPQVIKEDKSAWMTDEEFAREMLAGVNPVMIRYLQEFPPASKLDPKVYGDQRSKITKEQVELNLDGFTVAEAISKKKLFILDHHDTLMPYLRRINSTSTKAYSSRTVLFLQSDGTLKPLAIELSLPHPEGDQFGAISEVYTPAQEGVESFIWQLAKAYVAVVDSGFHQLISHWLYTHAAIEPFIIATNRQLSVLHPIHKLLHPHFRDTMNINALARQILINAGGSLESTVFAAKYSVEMSSYMYKDWVFPDQALPIDLLKRGMAVEDPTSPHGLRLLIEDYPYAVDGLEIWFAIKAWVQDYCSYYYETDAIVMEDSELQSWWKELREEGHGDKKDEPWWPKMQTLEELIESCTIIIWIASALHAAVNFGQYPFGGYPLNRPSRSRRFMPKKGSPEFDELMTNPEKAFLKTFTSQLQTVLDISLMEVLSRHTFDEVYLGQRDTPNWTSDKGPLEGFEKFGKKLREIEERIMTRNWDTNLKNRRGPVNMPYTLLCPSSVGGLTGMGIPNSISI